LCVFDHHIAERKLLESDVPFVLVSSAHYYPNSQLSGAGVCLKYALYADYMNLDSIVDDCGLWLYGALGIVADMCSMEVPENRYIVKRGLGYFKHPLIKKMVGGYAFDSTAISFSVAPLVNAAMRTNNNEAAMQLFLLDDEDEIGKLVNQMKSYREFQNQVVNDLMEDLMQQAESQMDRKCMFFILPDNIDAEVSGLIANKILAIVQRPLCVLRNVVEIDNDTGEVVKHELSGSMRATGVTSFKDIVESTGFGWCAGHENAAGIGFAVEEFEDFKVAIEEALADITFKIEIEADVELRPSQITEGLIKQMNAINVVSGSGFPPIKVLVRTDDYEVSTFSTQKHLKIIDESGLLIVQWNTDIWKTMKNVGEVTAVGTLSYPRYGKQNFLQLTVDDFIQQNE
jgi:single-stranded-DNA-specific exonuclease